jgi:hypothetical protein
LPGLLILGGAARGEQYNLLVRRLGIIFLMMLLPLQLTWGAAARYCSHETSNSAGHVGHHVHVHQTVVTDDGVAGPSVDGDDTDCGYCHLLGHAQPLIGNASSVTATAARGCVSAEISPPSCHVPDEIERPNWVFAT